MRCPQSGNGCPLFVFLRRFVFFLSKRKKVFKKFKKSFEREGSPALPGGGGRRLLGRAFAKKLRLLSKFGEQAPRRGGGRGTKRDQPRHKAAPWPGTRIPGPLLKKRRRRKARRTPSGRRPMPAVRRASFAPCRQPLQGRCRKRPARQEASPAAFTAGPRPLPGACRAAGGSRPGARREARRAPGRLRRAAAPRLRAPPAPRRRYRRLPRCGRKTPASRGRRPP